MKSHFPIFEAILCNELYLDIKKGKWIRYNRVKKLSETLVNKEEIIKLKLFS